MGGGLSLGDLGMLEGQERTDTTRERLECGHRGVEEGKEARRGLTNWAGEMS